MKNVLLISSLAYILGFLTKSFVFVSPSLDAIKPPASNQCETLNTAKSNLISISQNEYLEYTQIKDLKQKYEKADELLGKIMLLFLADIGFRLQKSTPIELPPPEAQTIPLSSPTITESPKAPQQPPIESIPADTGLTGKSKLIYSLRSTDAIQRALNDSLIENPKIESARGSLISKTNLKYLEGRYTGTISFLDGKREPLQVTWELTPDHSKSTSSGTFNLSLRGPTKNSETSGQGDFKNLITLANDSHGYLVSACGDECYLQLYYNAPSDQFYGNYYETIKGSKNKFERLGLVHLKK